MKLVDFKQKPILGILRGVGLNVIEPVVESVISAGLETLEITMNTPRAPELIKKIKDSYGNRLNLGAGTVVNLKELKSALDNGASFIVMPIVVKEVVEFCVKNKIPVFPGALTPSEIYLAHQMGATMVKIFPAKFFGPDYFKEIKGPFEKIELLACGGVTSSNLKDYFKCGASAVSFGASVFRKDWLEKKDFKAIGQAVRSFIEAWERIK
jgi:2-dehydro-3-deoxyphosphogluconate aldolase/(4S)-4-hydroxy-2-oxoglutarate aldolase